MIYVYLALFILSLLGLAYTLYSLEINRKLNIKKRQIAIRPNRNKFYIIFCINVILTLTFGGLFIYKLFYRPKVPVVPYEEIEKGGKAINKITPITTLSRDIVSTNFDGGDVDRDAYYYVIDKVLYRYDVKTTLTTRIDIPCDDFLLIRDNIVVCFEDIVNNETKTMIDIYDKETLRLEKTITIDGTLKKYFDISNFFLGYSANVIVESFDVNNLEKIGYVVTTYTYSDDEEPVVTKTEGEKVYIKDPLMPEYHNYDRVLIHLQYSLITDNIKTKSFCLTDYYMADIDGYIYLFCNAYKKDQYDNESFILKYNPNDMTISDYHTYDNIIYSSPIVYYEGISTYLTFIMYNINYPSFQEVLIDNTLMVINTKDTFVDIKGHNIAGNKQDVLVFDNKVMEIDNILYYDNNTLINYEVDKENNALIINEYKLDLKQVNKYILKVENDFTSGGVLDIKLVNDNYIVTYMIDNKSGYLMFNLLKDEINNEDNQDVKTNEVMLDINELTDSRYLIINNKLLTISFDDDNETIDVKDIKDLMEEKTESEK